MNPRQPASVHSTPSPFAPTSTKARASKHEHLACDLASPKPPDRIFAPYRHLFRSPRANAIAEGKISAI
jgi:hypothetical protein